MADSRFWIDQHVVEGDEDLNTLDEWFEVVDSQIEGIVAYAYTLVTAQVIAHALATSARYQDDVASWDGMPDVPLEDELVVNVDTNEEIA